MECWESAPGNLQRAGHAASSRHPDGADRDNECARAPGARALGVVLREWNTR